MAEKGKLQLVLAEALYSKDMSPKRKAWDNRFQGGLRLVQICDVEWAMMWCHGCAGCSTRSMDIRLQSGRLPPGRCDDE